MSPHKHPQGTKVLKGMEEGVARFYVASIALALEYLHTNDIGGSPRKNSTGGQRRTALQDSAAQHWLGPGAAMQVVASCLPARHVGQRQPGPPFSLLGVETKAPLPL